MARQRLSNTEALTSTPLRPPCAGEPFGAVRSYLPLADAPYQSTPGRETGVGPERFGGARIELGCYYGALAPKE